MCKRAKAREAGGGGNAGTSLSDQTLNVTSRIRIGVEKEKGVRGHLEQEERAEERAEGERRSNLTQPHGGIPV